MKAKAKLLALILSIAGMAIGNIAYAGPASERVFSTKALDLLEIGQLVDYSHTRGGTLGEPLNPVENGQIRVKLRADSEGKREAVVTMGEDGQLRPVSVWPASAGNPILPIFLESTLRAMSRATGGSAFYIRNRIKESLGTGGTIETVSVDVKGDTLSAQEITFMPFQADKNRERMGAFADLKLIFVVSDEMPGDIIRFAAATGDNGESYKEEIAFAELSESAE